MDDLSTNTISFRFDPNSNLPNAFIQLVDLSCVCNLHRLQLSESEHSLLIRSKFESIFVIGKKSKEKYPEKIHLGPLMKKWKLLDMLVYVYLTERKAHSSEGKMRWAILIYN